MVTILCSARAVSSQVSHEYNHQVSLNVEAYILEYRKTLQELTLSPQIKISASNLLVLGVLAMFLPRIFIVFTIVFIHIFFPPGLMNSEFTIVFIHIFFPPGLMNPT